MNTKTVVMWFVLSLTLFACGGDEEVDVPSCSEAVHHYYGTGCGFVDVATGISYTADEYTVICRNELIATDPLCRDSADEWLLCMSETTQAMTSEDCRVCERELEDWLLCR